LVTQATILVDKIEIINKMWKVYIDTYTCLIHRYIYLFDT
jgi:hypothetical protein